MSTSTGTITDPRSSAGSADDTSVLLTGIHHVALATADLDRLREFYGAVFDAESIELSESPEFRHAVLHVGASWLHAFELGDNPHTSGLPEMFTRGHLDHLGLDAPNEEAFLELRRRLIEQGASDGAITDYGPVLSVWFEDPDGMGCEVCWTRDPRYRGSHGPQPATKYDG